MAIFKGSRFDGSDTFLDRSKDAVYLDPIREPKFLPDKDDLVIEVQEGMRLHHYAKQLYGNADYEWILMDCNPQYSTPFDVKPGDRIVAPRPERVIGRA